MDKEKLNLLTIEGLGKGNKVSGDVYITYQLTDYGKAYLLSNPKLKTPSIFDDKKYIVTTNYLYNCSYILNNKIIWNSRNI